MVYRTTRQLNSGTASTVELQSLLAKRRAVTQRREGALECAKELVEELARLRAGVPKSRALQTYPALTEALAQMDHTLVTSQSEANDLIGQADHDEAEMHLQAVELCWVALDQALGLKQGERVDIPDDFSFVLKTVEPVFARQQDHLLLGGVRLRKDGSPGARQAQWLVPLTQMLAATTDDPA